jgi:ABC-type dipeptide/oligopeptide/nickel transport system ATPase subunit
MWRERGLTMVLVTHDSSIARRAQRIGVMKNGRLSFRQPRPGQAARVQAARTGADLEERDDLDSELPDFDDPDSEPADTITFD